MAGGKRVDAVFEGGGVKGIGLVGAVAATEARGFRFENVAGTSAGAIVAALIAAGYTAAELRSVMQAVDYRKFRDKDLLDQVPLLGPALSLGFENGIYEGEYFQSWLGELLEQKNKRTFADLVMPEYASDPRFRYKLQVVTADISRGKLVVLPRDSGDYGIAPDELGIAQAVRMSMSIPFFFEPVKLGDSYIVDGGVLSNFPVWLLDDKNTDDPPWPTFGYKLVEDRETAGAAHAHDIGGPVSLFAALFSTMMQAHDARYIEDQNFVRTIPVPTLGVRTTDFDLSKDRADALYRAGFEAAEKFLAGWDFEKYKARYRKVPREGRRARLAKQP